ncbi:hypothetical protein H6G81_31425 [Scytonema hofmannii FACHB-248]|uniref:Uncharacterized protein n=1 Tax=Scytonema hofmannii FACHB-248 TaxID=1842502 RepID=A0ABR8H074_9CYAN|nr:MULTISPECIES: hypothetical protein [Nostocales]MBD2608909.1 hypothetical protein [Scytonema hofmannii FACHB-248]
MTTILKIYFTTNQARIFTALILTGILSIGSNFTLIKNATAAPANLMPESTNEFIKENLTTNNLPRRVEAAVLRDASKRSQISIKDLKIVESTPQTWNNGCLGVSQPDEICTQALVPGWKVVVSDGKQKWVYHTNSNGRLLRIASAQTSQGNEAKLPFFVKHAVFQAASRRLNLPISQLNIVQVKQRTWNNGCLNLPGADEGCTQAIVNGWKVVVGAVDHTLVYHTNASGSALRLNEKKSEIADNGITPITIPTSELPPALNSNVIFRQISSGGFLGRTDETVLLNDGRIIRYEKGNANDLKAQVWQISPQQLKEFQLFLEKQKLSEFENLSYPAVKGSADYITYTITTSDGTIQYNDVSRNNLPKDLQTVVKAWNDIRNIAIANQIPDEIKPLPIPVSELPPQLDRNVVFRQISSGGFIGRTYETILLGDGRLIQYRIGDANDSERRVWRVSKQKVREFEQLLKDHRFRELENLSYPPTKGSADYITYTLTSDDTTVRYNDVSENSLPNNLQAVVKAWNQIRKTYQ